MSHWKSLEQQGLLFDAERFWEKLSASDRSKALILMALLLIETVDKGLLSSAANRLSFTPTEEHIHARRDPRRAFE